MSTMRQMIFSALMAAIMGCAVLALLGSCSSQEAGSQAADMPSSMASYSATGIELATQEEWQQLQDKIQEASAYTDSAPYTEESWHLLEEAKHMANRAMMDYPDTMRSLVRGSTQQLVSAMMTLQLKG